jgi:hypothetical protein
MRAHEIKAKKNRHYRRLFSFGGGLNSRDRDTEYQGYDGAGCDNRGYHRPIIVAFYAKQSWVFVLGVFPMAHQLILRNLDPRAFSYNARPSSPVSFKRRSMMRA